MDSSSDSISESWIPFNLYELVKDSALFDGNINEPDEPELSQIVDKSGWTNRFQIDYVLYARIDAVSWLRSGDGEGSTPQQGVHDFSKNPEINLSLDARFSIRLHRLWFLFLISSLAWRRSSC